METNDDQLEPNIPHEEQFPENNQINRSTTKETVVKLEEIEVNYFLQKIFNSSLMSISNLFKPNTCLSITLGGYSYYFQNQLKNGRKYYYCQKRHDERCHGNVTLSQKGVVVKKRDHTCNGKEDTPLVREYEKIGKRFKINGLSYYRRAMKSRNNYFHCINSYSNGEKCPGSITITPDRRIAKSIGHSCNKFFQECSTTPKELPTELHDQLEPQLGSKIKTEKVKKNFLIVGLKNGRFFFLSEIF